MSSIQLVALYTIARREFVRIFRIWTQTLLPSVITTTLYFLIFGSFIGRRIGEFDGFGYMTFIVPGLIMMTVISNSYMNVVSSFFGSKFQRNLEEMLISPMHTHVMILGFMSGGVLRGLIVGALVWGVSLVFAPIRIVHPMWVIGVIVLTTVFFALAGLINALFAKSFDDISIVPTFVLTPLTYLGGVFYSIKILPEFWQFVSKFNPILYLVNCFRYGFLGVSDVPVEVSVLALSAMIGVVWAIAYQMIRRGIGTTL